MKGKKSVTITTEDMLFAGLGVVAGLAINPLANKALEGQSQQVRDTVGVALPVAKVAGGGYLAMQKKVDRRAKWFGVGVAAEGTAELALRYIPANYISINGVDGNVFDMLGTTTVNIPIETTSPGTLPTGDLGFDDEGILGTEDLYAYNEMEEVL